MTDSTVIYDFGANNGDDIPYYLVKADRVVAVEANPVLAAGIKQRFTEAIAAGRLEVVAKVLTAGDDAPEVPFYVHRTNHVLSQFPSPANPAEFDRVVLPAVAVVDLIARFGAPHYIKIDIEHYDEAILRALFAANIRPPFISAESHSFEVFAALVALGGYRAFKLVDGITVPQCFRDHPIATHLGTARHSFPEHSAGPFGVDIPGPWARPRSVHAVARRRGLWLEGYSRDLGPPRRPFRRHGPGRTRPDHRPPMGAQALARSGSGIALSGPAQPTRVCARWTFRASAAKRAR